MDLGEIQVFNHVILLEDPLAAELIKLRDLLRSPELLVEKVGELGSEAPGSINKGDISLLQTLLVSIL